MRCFWNGDTYVKASSSKIVQHGHAQTVSLRDECTVGTVNFPTHSACISFTTGFVCSKLVLNMYCCLWYFRLSKFSIHTALWTNCTFPMHNSTCLLKTGLKPLHAVRLPYPSMTVPYPPMTVLQCTRSVHVLECFGWKWSSEDRLPIIHVYISSWCWYSKQAYYQSLQLCYALSCILLSWPLCARVYELQYTHLIGYTSYRPLVLCQQHQLQLRQLQLVLMRES